MYSQSELIRCNTPQHSATLSSPETFSLPTNYNLSATNPMSGLTLLFTAFVATAYGAALPQYFIESGPNYYCPVVDAATSVSGAPWQAGVSVVGGGNLQVSEAHEVGTSWEVGGEIGLGAGDILTAGAGFGFSVSTSVSDTIQEVAGYDCPEGAWTCSMQITPGMISYSGHMHLEEGEGCGTIPVNSWENENVQDNDPFTMQAPRKDDAGNGFFIAEICACKNLPGWADNGAPVVVCPQDCVAP